MKENLLFRVSILIIFFSVTTNKASAKPFINKETKDNYEESKDENFSNVSHLTLNSTKQELYFIRTIVYEIGILASISDNETRDYDDDNSDEVVQQQIHLTFNANNKNGTLDFGKVPLPVQKNISGQILTGIAPVHVGPVSNLDNFLAVLPITKTIANITLNAREMFTLETTNVTNQEQKNFVNNGFLPLLNNNDVIAL